MAIRVRKPAGAGPWVGQVAGYIPDPVARLRFLKAVAPGLPDEQGPRARHVKRWLLLALVVGAAALSLSILLRSARADPPRPVHHAGLPVAEVHQKAGPDVWLVESSGDSETYSNGLRVDNHFAGGTHARTYLAFPVRRGQPAERRTQPAGIVFHSTESLQAPFEARQNGTLKRIGESLLEYVRRSNSYNFVIDRFGRVFRVVPEDQAANHAGHSLWSDENWSYLNLNESFLGVSFEAETRAAELTEGQERSAIMLLEMLRKRYGISAANCVTHAQVSVNPANMRVGYHVDWAAGFPFESLGLPDNYATALPSVWQFGFESDDVFRGAAGVRLLAGVESAKSRFAEGARAAGISQAAYRKLLRKWYRELMIEVRKGGKGEESSDPD